MGYVDLCSWISSHWCVANLYIIFRKLNALQGPNCFTIVLIRGENDQIDSESGWASLIFGSVLIQQRLTVKNKRSLQLSVVVGERKNELVTSRRKTGVALLVICPLPPPVVSIEPHILGRKQFFMSSPSQEDQTTPSLNPRQTLVPKTNPSPALRP